MIKKHGNMNECKSKEFLFPINTDENKNDNLN